MSYNSKSKKAEEFICHEEIEETLRYAEEHKNDVEDMRKILERAKDCKGLSYREAALLLECVDESIHQEIFRLAEEIKEKFYRNEKKEHRFVFFTILFRINSDIKKKIKEAALKREKKNDDGVDGKLKIEESGSEEVS